MVVNQRWTVRPCRYIFSNRKITLATEKPAFIRPWTAGRPYASLGRLIHTNPKFVREIKKSVLKCKYIIILNQRVFF